MFALKIFRRFMKADAPSPIATHAPAPRHLRASRTGAARTRETQGRFLQRMVRWFGKARNPAMPSPALQRSQRGLQQRRTQVATREHGFFRQIANAGLPLRLQQLEQSGNTLRAEARFAALQDELEVYETKLARTLPADEVARATQATEALAHLDSAETLLLALYRAPPHKEALPQISALLAQVDAERQLLAAALNNRVYAQLGGGEVKWQDALGLRRVGIELTRTQDYCASQLHAPRALGRGVFNVVFGCEDAQHNRYVYKPELSLDKAKGAVADAARKGGLGDAVRRDNDRLLETPRYAARNIAASKLDQVLGTDVVVRARMGHLPLAQLEAVEPNLVARRVSGAEENAHAFTDYGLLMDMVDGGTLFEVAHVNHTAMQKAMTNGAFKRDLIYLGWMDALLGSLDRHPGNIVAKITPDGRYAGMRGIDNDMCLFAHNTQLAQSRGRLPNEPMHGLPAALKLTPAQWEQLNPDTLDNLIAELGGLVPRARFSLRSLTRPKQQAAFDGLRELVQQWSSADREVRGKMRGSQWLQNRFKLMGETMILAQSILECTQRPEFAAMPKIQEYGKKFVEAAEASFQRHRAQALGANYGQEFGPVNALGLPPAIDEKLAARLDSPTLLAEMKTATEGLLTEPEFAQLTERLATMRTHVAKLRDEGRVIANWNMPPAELDPLIHDPAHSLHTYLQDYLEGRR